jgi:hypothetical protein
MDPDQDDDQDPGPRYRFTFILAQSNGRPAAVYKIYRNGVLVKTTVIFLDEIESAEAGREE